MKEMVNACSVCSDERGWSENPLVYCDGSGCNIAVHQACYGIVEVPLGNWYCRRCELKDNTPVRCELCPFKGGALKKTDNNKWAHVVCALYIPEVKFLNVATMEPILLTEIPKERFFKQCYICDKNNKPNRSTLGACMQCNKIGCKLNFHVTCAQTLGLLCEEAGKHLNNVSYCGYCEEHYTKLKKNTSKCLQTYESYSSGEEQRSNLKSSGKKKNSSRSSSKSEKSSSHHNLNLIINLSSYPPTVSECSAKLAAAAAEETADLSKINKKKKNYDDPDDKEQNQNSSRGSNEQLANFSLKPSVVLPLGSFTESFSTLLSPPNEDEETSKNSKKNKSHKNLDKKKHKRKSRHVSPVRISLKSDDSAKNSAEIIVDNEKSSADVDHVLEEEKSSDAATTRFYNALNNTAALEIGVNSTLTNAESLQTTKILPAGMQPGNVLSSALKELLEKQWNQAGTFLMEQAEHLSIAAKLSELHKIQTEIIQAEDDYKNLISRRDHLLAVNTRLSLPMSLYDATQKGVGNTMSFLQKPIDPVTSSLAQLQQQNELNYPEKKLNEKSDENNSKNNICTDVEKPAK